MFTKIRNAIVGVFLVSIFAAADIVGGPSTRTKGFEIPGDVGPIAKPTPAEKVIFSAYKGISIGMKSDDVRSKLGNPKDKSDAMDLYLFSESESAQFYYGADRSVTAIMITFSGDLKSALTPMSVFGEDVPPKDDGGIFKMVRYPKAGFWISYNRTGGSDAVISIAMQKI